MGRRLLGLVGAAVLAVASPMPFPAPAAAEPLPLPAIWPTPQSVQDPYDIVPVTPTVALVVGPKTDRSAVEVVEQVLARAQVTQARVVADADPEPDAGLIVYIGGPSENSASDRALDEIGIVADATGLPHEGYVLGIGKGGDGKARVVLDGVDPTGTFYAAQTLRQLLVPHPGRDVFPAVTVRDW
ncbi:glycoside hydrolase family 20 zincin-like fold domain-containing protein, partial [Micromonospora yasonensis]|uniref:glycoside hydrolase family 20 zincin-like fold domain-containing protein n=1 Tax=Micromonospora yasonensis TaxID=1128667 RepID=UPI0022306487